MATTTSFGCPKYVQFRLRIYWPQVCLPKSKLCENEEKSSLSCVRTDCEILPSKSPYRYGPNPSIIEKKHEYKASAREHINI